jgi:hypothetical protein
MGLNVNADIAYAVRTAAFSLQCAAFLDYFHKRDPNSTGFHRLAANAMAKRALAALDAVAENADDVPELLGYCDEAAESSVNILRAYLKQRDSDEAGE